MRTGMIPIILMGLWTALSIPQLARAEDKPSSSSPSTVKEIVGNQSPSSHKEDQKDTPAGIKPNQLNHQSPKTIKKPQVIDINKKKESTQNRSETTANPNEPEKKFIDRDGDGIQDGQEHRFRGRHRSRGHGKRESGLEIQNQRRLQTGKTSRRGRH